MYINSLLYWMRHVIKFISCFRLPLLTLVSLRQICLEQTILVFRTDPLVESKTEIKVLLGEHSSKSATLSKFASQLDIRVEVNANTFHDIIFILTRICCSTCGRWKEEKELSKENKVVRGWCFRIKMAR